MGTHPERDGIDQVSGDQPTDENDAPAPRADAAKERNECSFASEGRCRAVIAPVLEKSSEPYDFSAEMGALLEASAWVAADVHIEPEQVGCPHIFLAGPECQRPVVALLQEHDVGA